MTPTLDSINVNELLSNDLAACIQIDGMWYLVAEFVPQTKYFFTVLLVNGENVKTVELQRDTEVTIVNPDQAKNLGIVID